MNVVYRVRRERWRIKYILRFYTPEGIISRYEVERWVWWERDRYSNKLHWFAWLPVTHFDSLGEAQIFVGLKMRNYKRKRRG